MIILNGFQYLKFCGYYTKTPNYASFLFNQFPQIKKCGHFLECFSPEKMTALYINKIYSLLSNIAICLVAAIQAPT